MKSAYDKIAAGLEDAIAYAEASPQPDVSDLLKDVYTVSA